MERWTYVPRPSAVILDRAAASCVLVAGSALLLAACTGASAPADTASFSAMAACQHAAAPGATVSHAYPATVEQVRSRRHSEGGTPPTAGKSPVDGLTDWTGLTAQSPAAWCAIKAGDRGYEITAVAPGARLVTFVTSAEPLDPGPNGPAFP